MQNNLNYYLEQGIMTEVTTMKSMIKDIPTSVPEIVKLVQNFLLHQHWAKRYGVDLTKEQQLEPTIRDFNAKLELLYNRGIKSINQPFSVHEKLIGICRDFSVIGAALCREVGIPARARCGFASYFEKGKFIDHWVLEYWNYEEKKWIMVDAQLDSFQQDLLRLTFNTLDVSKNHFIPAGEAWIKCRKGLENPELFGIFQWWGYDYLKCNLILDANSLLKVPMQPWDSWKGYKGTLTDEFTENDFLALDKLANLTISVDSSMKNLKQFVNNNDKIKADITNATIPF